MESLESGKYRCIQADPPWEERGAGKIKRGADRHYPLMKASEIAAMGGQVMRVAHPKGCHLWLWVTNNKLKEGLHVMGAWGFRYVTNLAWGKVRNGSVQIGLGQYLRGSHELCLFGVRGKIPYQRTADGKRVTQPSLVLAARTRHSAKPRLAVDAMERVSPGPRLELFAIGERPGWDVWGDEA